MSRRHALCQWMDNEEKSVEEITEKTGKSVICGEFDVASAKADDWNKSP